MLTGSGSCEQQSCPLVGPFVPALLTMVDPMGQVLTRISFLTVGPRVCPSTSCCRVSWDRCSSSPAVSTAVSAIAATATTTTRTRRPSGAAVVCLRVSVEHCFLMFDWLYTSYIQYDLFSRRPHLVAIQTRWRHCSISIPSWWYIVKSWIWVIISTLSMGPEYHSRSQNPCISVLRLSDAVHCAFPNAACVTCIWILPELYIYKDRV